MKTSEEKINWISIYRQTISKNYGKFLFINSASEKTASLKDKEKRCQSRIIYSVNILFKISIRYFGNTEAEDDTQLADLHYHTHVKEPDSAEIQWGVKIMNEHKGKKIVNNGNWKGKCMYIFSVIWNYL